MAASGIIGMYTMTRSPLVTPCAARTRRTGIPRRAVGYSCRCGPPHHRRVPDERARSFPASTCRSRRVDGGVEFAARIPPVQRAAESSRALAGGVTQSTARAASSQKASRSEMLLSNASAYLPIGYLLLVATTVSRPTSHLSSNCIGSHSTVGRIGADTTTGRRGAPNGRRRYRMCAVISRYPIPWLPGEVPVGERGHGGVEFGHPLGIVGDVAEGDDRRAVGGLEEVLNSAPLSNLSTISFSVRNSAWASLSPNSFRT